MGKGVSSSWRYRNPTMIAKVRFFPIVALLPISVHLFWGRIRSMGLMQWRSGDGRLVALVFRSRCLFKSVADGAIIGEISLVGTSLYNEDSSSKVRLIGGIFLQDDDSETGNSSNGVVKTVALWNTNGAAVVFRISFSGVAFDFKPLCEIPSIPSSSEGKSSIHFCQLNGDLIRIVSNCVTVGKSSVWEPHVSRWSIQQLESTAFSKLLAEGSFSGEWPIKGRKNTDLCKRTVSSSMVLSEDFYAPYSVVYGFYSGEIEVIRFINLFPEVKSGIGGIYPHISEQFFSGHSGAILCLATHRMHAQSNEQNFSRVLISGSLDCTIRVWDFDTGNPLSSFHHHVAPVRQIILPPPWTNKPWKDCFLSVGDDGCVALVSLETMRVERMFPGHPSYPSMVAWDSKKGYIACLCRNLLSSHNAVSVLYLWDVKSGARERIIRGAASHLVFDHFCRGINKNSITGGILGGTTSASSLLLPVFKDKNNSQLKNSSVRNEKGTTGNFHRGKMDTIEFTSLVQSSKEKEPARDDFFRNIRSFGSYVPLIAMPNCDVKQLKAHHSDHESQEIPFEAGTSNDNSNVIDNPSKETLEGRLLRFSLCFLHLWGVDGELDKLLVDEMNICKPEGFHIAPGVVGDRGSITLMFPGMWTTLELWKSSSEFCAMRSLTIVSLAQHIITLSHSCTTASSALAAFYTRNFAEKVPHIKPPLLQLLVSFWQHPCEHVRMAARSLFHCAAPRAVPCPLYKQKIKSSEFPSSPLNHMENLLPDMKNASLTDYLESEGYTENLNRHESESSPILSWLDSFENQEWVSWIGATSQDAKASNIIVAAALAAWYPSIVKDELPNLVVNQLIKLLMSMNDRYSSTAAELLAEGMESTWKDCLGADIPKLTGDIFFQIECLSGTPASCGIRNPVVAVTIREALVDILLPTLAMADIVGFFGVIEGQIWATSSDSPVHLVSVKTLIRVVRGSPKTLAPYLDKVINYVLQTMDPSNLVMRKACLSGSMVALREIARVFPMVALNESLTRLAVGDAIGDIHTATIRVYDIESVTKIKILDASGPPGLPSLLEGASSTKIAIAISALSFSPDGEGLVAFSENGLMIRWWSLGTAWWERISRNSLVPVQCTKLIFVPPWEGFSPNSSPLSIMASIIGNGKQANSRDKLRELNDADNLKLLIHNLDLSYRLQWIGGRTIKLTRHGQELGTFQL
uniref:Uncharacterized protein n=1 Tax=Ananas comosus var. bracteatus TaxID=296719 RepID=A0A6V7QW68_ANACO